MTWEEKYKRKLEIGKRGSKGEPTESLSKEFGLCETHIKGICDAYKLMNDFPAEKAMIERKQNRRALLEKQRMERQKIKIEKLKKIETLLNEDLSCREIAEQIGVKQKNLIHIINNNELKLPKERRREKREKLYAQILRDSKKMSYEKLKKKYGREMLKDIGRHCGVAFKKIWNQTRIERAKKLLSKGYSTKQLMVLFRVSRETVSDFRTQIGVVRPRLDGEAKLKRDKRLLEDLANGMSRKKAEKKYKLTNIAMVVKDYK